MTDEPPLNVPNSGPIELQLLAIQRELSFFKSYYVEMNEKINKIHSKIGQIEHMELFTKIVKIIDEYLDARYRDEI